MCAAGVGAIRSALSKEKAAQVPPPRLHPAPAPATATAKARSPCCTVWQAERDVTLRQAPAPTDAETAAEDPELPPRWDMP